MILAENQTQRLEKTAKRKQNLRNCLSESLLATPRRVLTIDAQGRPVGGSKTSSLARGCQACSLMGGNTSPLTPMCMYGPNTFNAGHNWFIISKALYQRQKGRFPHHDKTGQNRTCTLRPRQVRYLLNHARPHDASSFRSCETKCSSFILVSPVVY